MLISDLTFEHQQWKQKLWRWNRWDHHNYRYRIGVPTNTGNRWKIQYCNRIFSQIYRLIFKSGWIYSQIYEPRQDLKVHNTLLWCHFRLRLQLKRDLHLWEEPASKAPTMWVVSYLGSTRIYTLHRSTRIYTLHRSTRIYTLNGSTRLTTSQDLHPNTQPFPMAIWLHPSVTHPSVPDAVSYNKWHCFKAFNNVCHCVTPKT